MSLEQSCTWCRWHHGFIHCPHSCCSNCSSGRSHQTGTAISVMCKQGGERLQCRQRFSWAAGSIPGFSSGLQSCLLPFCMTSRSKIKDRAVTGEPAAGECFEQWKTSLVITPVDHNLYLLRNMHSNVLTFHTDNSIISYGALTGAMKIGSPAPANAGTLLTAEWAGSQR